MDDKYMFIYEYNIDIFVCYRIYMVYLNHELKLSREGWKLAIPYDYNKSESYLVIGILNILIILYNCVATFSGSSSCIECPTL